MADGFLGGVGETALGAAMLRADERARSDRLFDDPYAAAFIAAAPDIFADGPDPGDPESNASGWRSPINSPFARGSTTTT
jgi:O-methyltransferase involved in polyketide biosynthesis